MIFVFLSLILFLVIVNTLILTVVSLALAKSLGITDTEEEETQSVQEIQLMDLPMKYEQQFDYGDLTRTAGTPKDIRMVRDE